MEDDTKMTPVYLEMEPHNWVLITMSHADRRKLLAATRLERRYLFGDIAHITYPIEENR